MEIDKIQRLIAIKTEHLNALRQDMRQLDMLHASVRQQHDAALKDYQDYAAQILVLENRQYSSATEMMDRRRYVVQLHQVAEQARQALENVQQQQDLAKETLMQSYTEVKSLELLAERQQASLLQEERRKMFVLADDEQMLRYMARAD
ncbi:hypothetical protein LG198_14220 [Methylobacillus arboreus]|uniref:hypothetical protein n=1 Tax=Methylobacillus arboreus TaxID=755170 RepID=UPI001E2F4A15|nr:hypothetical protein [Methylobacillus arboreus]MCB5191885.1 hypothetical protein [Methylobacillus arboreus]